MSESFTVQWTTRLTFASSNHKRIENRVQTSHDYVPRLVILDYNQNGHIVNVSVAPTLTPKIARLVKDVNNVLYYEGADPDYRFEVETDSRNELIRVSVIRNDKNLELRYLK
jgi:hypothetical protein